MKIWLTFIIYGKFKSFFKLSTIPKFLHLGDHLTSQHVPIVAVLSEEKEEVGGDCAAQKAEYHP